jgi:hypothetical protein
MLGPYPSLAVALVCGAELLQSQPPTSELPFDKNVKVTATADAWVVESDGIPTHPTGTFPNSTNPNRIQKQDYKFTIPRHPEKADKPTPTPFGPIGVAINGVPFYNPYNAEGRDAVLGPFAEVFDSCCGHPDPMGRYHYHKYPACIKSPFVDPKGKHSPLLGYMFDGFALYGPNGSDGEPPTDLDACNGHDDPDRGYHYHVTVRFPYLIGSYRGTPEPSNIDRPRFAGRNGPFTKGAPGGPGGGQGRPPMHPVVRALDRDGDGTLSADEIKNAAEALKSLDGDGDGMISPEELRPAGPPRQPDPPRNP